MIKASGDREILGIIPARGGSKGIPRKNVRLLNGKPLIAHTIEQALASALITRTAVTTDDEEIASISEQYGAEVIRRPADLTTDSASTESALIHALNCLYKGEQYSPGYLVCLQCTSPLTLTEDIDGTISLLINEQADTALSVKLFHYFVWQVDNDSNAVGINHDKLVRLLRQEREPQYLETGAIYVMRTDGFLQAHHRFFGKTVMYVMPSERCLEVDEPVDFQIAEVLMRAQRTILDAERLPHPIAAIVLDFDGVFTDNRVLVFQDGTEAVVCHRGDGMGLALLHELGIPLLVLSTEQNPVVEARCRKLQVECLHGLSDKRAALQDWLTQHQLTTEKVVYVGNDINDVSCMEMVGCPVAVADAHPDVRKHARIVLRHAGGDEAIRELCDLVRKQREKPDASNENEQPVSQAVD